MRSASYLEHCHGVYGVDRVLREVPANDAVVRSGSHSRPASGVHTATLRRHVHVVLQIHSGPVTD